MPSKPHRITFICPADNYKSLQALMGMHFLNTTGMINLLIAKGYEAQVLAKRPKLSSAGQAKVDKAEAALDEPCLIEGSTRREYGLDVGGGQYRINVVGGDICWCQHNSRIAPDRTVTYREVHEWAKTASPPPEYARYLGH